MGSCQWFNWLLPRSRLGRLDSLSVTKPKPAGATRSAQKRQAILDQAADLFLAQGFSETSMDEVAERAGVSKQTVYSQFSSKEALFVAMARAMIHPSGDLVQQGMEALPRGNSIKQHLLAYALRQVEVVRTPRLMQLRRLAIAEAARFPEMGKALYDAGPGRAIAGLAQVFTTWDAEGLLRVADAQVAATHFNWLVMADPVNRVMLLGDAALPSAAALKRHAREAVRVFLAAYGAGDD